MSDSGATPKVSRKVLSRRSNRGAIFAGDARELGAAAKYELKDPVTSRAAELNIMSGTLGPNVLDISHLARDRIIAKLPTIAAAAYKHTLGQPFIYPRNDLRYCANILNMFFAVPCEPYSIDPVAVEALDLLFILHADHEQNASTSTVRLAGSTGVNPYAAISAGISALWGPAHGGANEAVLDMLDGIGSAANIGQFLARVKDKSDNVRLMGFGHRVYKNVDPRAKIIRSMCYRVLESLGKGNSPLFELALKLEEVALTDDYFVSRRLYPNVDFYSGIIYSALGIPRSMFTVMFAIARTAGWVAHWQEMVSDPHMRIGRPRQLYTGPTKRDYQAIEKRDGGLMRSSPAL